MFTLNILEMVINLESVRKSLSRIRNDLRPESNFITFVSKADLTRNTIKLSKIR